VVLSYLVISTRSRILSRTRTVGVYLRKYEAPEQKKRFGGEARWFDESRRSRSSDGRNSKLKARLTPSRSWYRKWSCLVPVAIWDGCWHSLLAPFVRFGPNCKHGFHGQEIERGLSRLWAIVVVADPLLTICNQIDQIKVAMSVYLFWRPKMCVSFLESFQNVRIFFSRTRISLDLGHSSSRKT